MSHGTADETLWERLAHPAIPLDLLFVVGYVVLAAALVFQPGVYATPLAVVLGLPLLLFAPGYALVSLLFPGATPDDDFAGGRSLTDVRERGLSGTERLALGFGVSLALLPPIGVALAFAWTIEPVSILAAVGGLTVVASVGAAVRRLRRPTDRRFAVPVQGWLKRARGGLSGSATDVVLNVALAAGVVVAIAAVGYAVAVPGPGQQYTDVALLTQNQTGEFVAEDYPQEFTRGQSRPVVLSLQNHEGEQTSYSVVVELQRVRKTDSGAAKVVQERRLARFTPTVEAGQTWRTRHDVTPTMTGDNLRLNYLVYKGEPPQNPTSSNAYEHVHVWVNVSA